MGGWGNMSFSKWLWATLTLKPLWALIKYCKWHEKKSENNNFSELWGRTVETDLHQPSVFLCGSKIRDLWWSQSLIWCEQNQPHHKHCINRPKMCSSLELANPPHPVVCQTTSYLTALPTPQKCVFHGCQNCQNFDCLIKLRSILRRARLKCGTYLTIHQDRESDLCSMHWRRVFPW